MPSPRRLREHRSRRHSHGWGETAQSQGIFAAVLKDPGRDYWYDDYGSALRDQFATAVLTQESGVMGPQLSAIRAALPGANLDPDTLNTQEQAWGGAAAAAMGANARPVSVVADNKTLGPAPTLSLPVTGRVTVRNIGHASLPGSLVVQGVPLQAPAAARAGMEVHRHFFAQDGSALDPDKLAQNTTFVMVVDGRATEWAGSSGDDAGRPAGGVGDRGPLLRWHHCRDGLARHAFRHR